jgi:formylglycine-generating enzyme required for sulfatase activity/serine/threonine protein kinase
MDLTGRQLGDYRLIEAIRSGGLCDTYLAEHADLRQRCILKVLPEELIVISPGFVSRFHDEAAVLTDLRHPRIVPVLEMAEADGRYFIVTEYVAGPRGQPMTLQDYLRLQPDGRVSEVKAQRWAVQLAEALAYAHARGACHWNIKPSNVIIDKFENLRLTDFGLARVMGREFLLARLSERLAPQPGRRGPSVRDIMEAADYLAPEQRSAAGPLDARTDVYSFGAVIYRILTGQQPATTAVPPTMVVPTLASKWDTLIGRCLVERARRHAGILDALADIRRVGGRSIGGLVAAGIAVFVATVLVGFGIAHLGDIRDFIAQQVAVPTTQGPPSSTEPETPPQPQAGQTVSLKDAADTQAKADEAWAKVKDLDRGQGFAAALDQAADLAHLGIAHLKNNAFAKAKGAFDEFVGRCDAIAGLDTLRNSALAAKSEAAAAQESARRAGVAADSPAVAAADKLTRDAESAFDAANFAEAQAAWKGAAAALVKAPEQAAALARAKAARAEFEKALAAQDVSRLQQYAGPAWQKVADAARAADAAGDPEKAAAAWRDATRLISDAVKAADAAAKAESAAKTQTVAKAGDQNATPLIAEAERHIKAGQWQQAFAAIQKALAINPANPAAIDVRHKIEPNLPRDISIDLGGGFSMRLILIQPARFLMGSPPDEPGRSDDEGPQHQVTLRRPFYMGSREVTQEEYAAVMGANPSSAKNLKAPVDLVSWFSAEEFCKKLSEKSGHALRLPTEAEWEFACRAGTTTAFSTGARISTDQADFEGSQPFADFPKSTARGKAMPAGSFKPNAWGLFDMHGNVWEWCADWYDEKYYAASPGADPPGPETAKCRVVRGGSWAEYAGSARSANRDRYPPATRAKFIGFRVVADY